MHRLPTGGNVKNALKSVQNHISDQAEKIKKRRDAKNCGSIRISLAGAVPVGSSSCQSSQEWLEQHTAAVQLEEAHNSGTRCDGAVKGGKEVGGEHETKPAKIFKHIRGMAIYLKPQNWACLFPRVGSGHKLAESNIFESYCLAFILLV